MGKPGFVRVFLCPKNFFKNIFGNMKNVCIFAKQNNNIMTQSTNITSELIQSMYNSTNNKMRFIQVFGTTRFRFQSEETLNRMFQYLQTKNK